MDGLVHPILVVVFIIAMIAFVGSILTMFSNRELRRLLAMVQLRDQTDDPA